MKYSLRKAMGKDARAMLDIFNWYAQNSPACYAEEALPLAFMESFMERCQGYPFLVAVDEGGRVVGFGNLHPHHTASSFRETAEITYFLADEVTGKGIGSRMHRLLVDEAKKRGVKCVMASISSRNKGSINFHEKLGFEHCGRFRRIGKKRGREFDVVWMQLFI